MSEEQNEQMDLDSNENREERLAVTVEETKEQPQPQSIQEPLIPPQSPITSNPEIPSSPAPDQTPPKPSPEPQTFLPKEFSADGLYNLAAFMQMQGRISTDEFTYLHRISFLLRSTEQKLEAASEKIQNARAILDEDLPPLTQADRQHHNNPQGQQLNVMELFEVFKAMMIQQSREQQAHQEPPKSFLIKKGDEHEIKEIQEREELAKKASIVGSSQSIETQAISKEEMDRRRRERAAMLQKQQEDSLKEREEMERKAKAREAFFKNDGTSRIGRP
ncbi:unnamed protein product [Blepharisma stoltei]|uniref:Uncharacterized protein n=1 Tax=Blepharisma stoltei TaxID=1481888 RepID=A0AAU9JUN0_9CILI|nr:unnamed protein product [Blepharisma stoltei]